jgi:DNA-binding transcriptional MerR regulator
MALAGRELFQTRDVIEILKISRRQLQYWAQTDLIVPSAQTPGGHGRYTFEDLVALKAAKRLIDAGVSVQRIRKSIRTLRRILPNVRRPLAELILVATGDVVLAFRDGTAFEAVSGQEWIFEVAQFQREIEEPATSRPPAEATTPYGLKSRCPCPESGSTDWESPRRHSRPARRAERAS